MITSEIIKLVDLALSDAVLTPKERAVIVEKAVKEGIPAMEINAYIDSALQKRLATRSKAELKDCPQCGAQIPLISQNCPYCGHQYQLHKAGNVMEAKSHEADIIEIENQKEQEKKANLKNCPNCGHPYPLISNICPACSHVLHYGDENKRNIQQLINKIEEKISQFYQLPKITLVDVFKYRHPEYSFIAFAVSAVIIKLNPNISDTISVNLLVLPLLLLALLFAAPVYLLPIIAISKKNDWIKKTSFIWPFFRGESPVGLRNKAVAQFLTDYQSLERQIETIYGADKECKQLIASLKEKLNQAVEFNKKLRSGVLIKNLLLLAFVAICAVASLTGEKGRNLNTMQNFFLDKDIKLMTQQTILQHLHNDEINDCFTGDFKPFAIIDSPVRISCAKKGTRIFFQTSPLEIKATSIPLGNSQNTGYGFALLPLNSEYKHVDDNLILYCQDNESLIELLKTNHGSQYHTFSSIMFPQKQEKELNEALKQAKYFAVTSYKE